MADLPEPVQVAMAVLGSLTGVVLLFGGTALLAVPKIAELKLALATLGVTAATTNGIMATLGVAGAAGAAIGGLVALGFALESTRCSSPSTPNPTSSASSPSRDLREVGNQPSPTTCAPA